MPVHALSLQSLPSFLLSEVTVVPLHLQMSMKLLGNSFLSSPEQYSPCRMSMGHRTKIASEGASAFPMRIALVPFWYQGGNKNSSSVEYQSDMRVMPGRYQTGAGWRQMPI